MKKLLVIALAIASIVIVKKTRESEARKGSWKQGTDSVA
ncbi:MULTISPECIES: DLW-39 family protein [Arthrobacter]|uniref:DLW-39 family protein n=2 Tax=Arthrobacter TaxID=1663 RepID=A0ABU9KJ00_9MICC|nr:DLW-39 family protein [Arthrobacter sp. YJM1]MDP5226881.1 DLW-39 family protein [Arthrobacter sp. YJM1]